MQPTRDSTTIRFPVTFDGGGGTAKGNKNKWGWLLLLAFVWVMGVIVVLVASDSFFKFIYPFASAFLLSYIVRFLIFRERYYKQKRSELIENDFNFEHTVFWNIYEVSNRYPHIITFGNGYKGVFITLDKDVIVGKGEDAMYRHHEAIADAYKVMAELGIECEHIDYVDTLGNDQRLQGLFKQAENTENPDLQALITHIYDYTEHLMKSTYSSYDVYAFYSMKRDDVLWESLQPVLAELRNANYLRARVLNKNEIALLVKTLMNIGDFSMNRTNEALFRGMEGTSKYITPIWTETNGERIKLNKTSKELEEDTRVRKVEKEVKRKSIFKRNKKKDDQEIDLFK